jgi:hypothetical protein
MLSWSGAMIRLANIMVMQLRLDLAECPAPAAALWELVGAEQRQRALTLLAALIARASGGEAIGDELVSLGGAGAPGGRDD